MPINTLVFYILLPALVAGGLILFFLKRDKKTKKVGTILTAEKPVTNTEAVTVRLWDSRFGNMWTETTLSGEIVDDIVKNWRNLGRMWEEDGVKMYEINRYQLPNGEYSYRPIGARIVETRDNSPQRVEGAFHHDTVPIVYNVKSRSSMFAKLGPILLFCGGAIFAMVMIIGNVSK